MRKIIRRGQLTGTQRKNLAKLLDMLYTPSELGVIIGFSRRQFYRVYIPAGCPHERGENGRLWINGATFRQWYFEHYPKIKLAANEAYCLACKRVVAIANPKMKQSGTYRYWSFYCPNCGHLISKAIPRGDVGHDQS